VIVNEPSQVLNWEPLGNVAVKSYVQRAKAEAAAASRRASDRQVREDAESQSAPLDRMADYRDEQIDPMAGVPQRLLPTLLHRASRQLRSRS
jgi:hypothetical protein